MMDADVIAGGQPSPEPDGVPAEAAVPSTLPGAQLRRLGEVAGVSGWVAKEKI
jgi:hypothetical protein